MDTKSMTRKEFVTLTFTLLGGAATAAACSSSSNSTGTGGTNGTGSGGTAGGACTDPLPDSMVADDTMHTHTLTVPASTLNASSDQTLTTGPVMDATGTIAAHTHPITFTTSDLSILKAGGAVTVVTQLSDGHTHTYRVSCTTAGIAGSGAAGSTGTAGNGAAGTSGAAGANGAAGINGAAGH
jgi:collagen type I/II/III/V/XI/XXIV/XXVII alpha